MEHLQDNVYAIPGNLRQIRPWLGAIITSDGTVLVDSGNGPPHAEDVRAELAKAGAPPVSHIILTHHHWDHVFGSCVFPDAVVIAHELTQYHLEVMAAEPWSKAYVAGKASDKPLSRAIAALMLAAVPEWDDFRVLPADVTFTSNYRLTLGETDILVEHVGGQHEPDQCIVHVRPANVLFLGDATYGRGQKEHWDLAGLADEMEAFLTWNARYFVEGHRKPATPDVFRARIAQLRNQARDKRP